MHIRTNEKILKIFHHHPFPYGFKVLKIVLSSLPFYFLLFLLRSAFSESAFVVSTLLVTVIFIVVLLYTGILYWLDRLIVTNQRVVHINWVFFSVKRQHEVELGDIQDIETKEQGIFSYFRIFDFGEFVIQTAASRVSILFDDAPDPEGIKHFVYASR